MTFERSMQQQPHELRVVLVVLKGSERESFKDRAVVLQPDCIRHHLARVAQAFGAGFIIKDGCVEFFFGGEVAEDHRL